MKFVFDLFPVLLFFAAFKLAGIFTATAVLMAASLAQTLIFRVIKGKFETMHVVTLVLVAIFGGATLAFHDAAFIQWKPTVISCLFAAAAVPLTLIAGTCVGLLLNRLGRLLAAVVSTAALLAWATPTIAATVIFFWLFSPDGGVADWLLARMPHWLVSARSRCRNCAGATRILMMQSAITSSSWTRRRAATAYASAPPSGRGRMMPTALSGSALSSCDRSSSSMTSYGGAITSLSEPTWPKS